MQRLAQERAVRRRDRAKLFLLILCVLIFAISIYSILDRHSWLTPSAIFFSWFGYWVLVVTFIAQARTTKGKP